jgi:hypothetical protein
MAEAQMPQEREYSLMITSTNHMSPTTKKAHWTCSTTGKMWTITTAHLTGGVETIQLKVMSILETNTMMEQTWVITKAL